MSKVLFLGGSKDGETVEVPADRWDVRVIKTESRVLASPVSASDTVEYEEEIYTRQRLRGQDQTFEVFAPSGWTGDMLISHLLRCAAK